MSFALQQITFLASGHVAVTYVNTVINPTKPTRYWLLTVYAKAKHDNIPAHILRALKDRFADDSQD